jgi:hypothetical protein
MDQKSLQNTNVKRFLTVYVVYYFSCNVPPHTIGIILTFLRYYSCVTTDGADTTLPLWVVVNCAVNLGMGLLVMPIIVLAFKARCRKSYVPIWVLFFFNGCFSVAWFIYGGVILFTEPGDNCKNAEDGLVVWEVGIAIWVLTIIISTGQHCVRKIADLRPQPQSENNKSLSD